MKPFLKKAGIWTGVFILALILLSFLFPSSIQVERDVKIDAPMFRVWDQVNDLRNWEKWSPWKRMDPAMVMTFSNPPVGAKAFYKWESNDKRLGKGTLTITDVQPEQSITTELVFDGRGRESSQFAFKHDGQGVRLTWSMKMHVGSMPWHRYFGAMMKGELKKQFDEGLKAIKFYAEQG